MGCSITLNLACGSGKGPRRSYCLWPRKLATGLPLGFVYEILMPSGCSEGHQGDQCLD